MDNSLTLLSATAVSIAFLHTLLGPDHYLPFIVLSKARKWTTRKTMIITFLCGLGHVLSSIVLGLIGIAVGISVNRLVSVESFRGSIAGWLFIAFGLVYMIISVRNLVRKKTHSHKHFHMGGEDHEHEHGHNGGHVHVHETDPVSTTPWILFLIFVFGPCEVLIPMLIYPAAELNAIGVALVALVFGTATIGTMMIVVLLGYKGVSMIKFEGWEYLIHILAGFVILLAGAGMQFMGL